MEFIMTYGWAILVMVILISGLYYLGLLSPYKLLAEKCHFPPGIGCIDMSANNDSITFYLANNAGMNIRNVSINIDTNSPCGSADVIIPSWESGERKEIVLSCNTTITKQYVTGVVQVSYIPEKTNIRRNLKGDVGIRVNS